MLAKKWLPPLALILAVAAMCSPALLAAGQAYQSEWNNFTVNFPDGWNYAPDNLGADVVATSPPNSDGKNYKVIISVADLAEPVSLKAYADENLDLIKTFYADVTELGQGETTIDGMPAYWYAYTYRPGEDQELLNCMNYLLISGNKAYLIECDATQATYEQAKKAFAQIAASMHLLPPGPEEDGLAPDEDLTEIPTFEDTPPMQGTAPTPEPTPAPAKPPTEARTSQTLPPFVLSVEQNGKQVAIKNHRVTLRKQEFTLIFTFAQPGGVLVNASARPKSFEAAAAGKSLQEIPGFSSPGSLGLVEKLRNETREIYVADDDYQYWFYRSPESNRFEKVEEKFGTFICRRTVKNFLLDFNKPSTAIDAFLGDTLYLVVVMAPRPSRFFAVPEAHRDYLQIIFR